MNALPNPFPHLIPLYDLSNVQRYGYDVFLDNGLLGFVNLLSNQPSPLAQEGIRATRYILCGRRSYHSIHYSDLKLQAICVACCATKNLFSIITLEPQTHCSRHITWKIWAFCARYPFVHALPANAHELRHFLLSDWTFRRKSECTWYSRRAASWAVAGNLPSFTVQSTAANSCATALAMAATIQYRACQCCHTPNWTDW
jgi:hypothetical protein